MRNSNGTKYLVILALLISVTALSLGFAAFSNTLTIKSSAAVGVINDLGVVLSTSKTSATGGTVTPTVSGATGDAVTLTANSTTISGLKATFTAPGQYVTYTMAAYNKGNFTYYLNQVNLGAITCTAGSGTTQSYVDSACAGIKITVTAGTDSYYRTTATNQSTTTIASHTVAASAGEDVIVKIEYVSGAAVADGDFTVAFGDTTLVYGTAD